VSKKLLSTVFVLISLVFLVSVALNFFNQVYQVQALSDVDKLQQEIDDLQHLKELSESATTPLEAEVANLEARIRVCSIGDQ
jgi:archaellum component FlaC